jgi:hypothetical protein
MANLIYSKPINLFINYCIPLITSKLVVSWQVIIIFIRFFLLWTLFKLFQNFWQCTFFRFTISCFIIIPLNFMFIWSNALNWYCLWFWVSMSYSKCWLCIYLVNIFEFWPSTKLELTRNLNSLQMLWRDIHWAK